MFVSPQNGSMQKNTNKILQKFFSLAPTHVVEKPFGKPQFNSKLFSIELN